MFNTNDDGLDEPKVHGQFLAANDSRIQTLKHVLTQQKPWKKWDGNGRKLIYLKLLMRQKN